MRPLLIAVYLFALSPLAFAQEFPRSEFYAGYSILRTDSEDVDLMRFGLPGAISRRDNANLNGFSMAATGNFNRWIGIVGEFSGHYGNINERLIGITGPVGTLKVKTGVLSVLAGPQLYFASGRVKPFLRPTIGFARLNRDVDLGVFGGRQKVNDTALAFGIGGGLDVRFAKRVSARLFQIDYVLTRFDTGGLGSNTQKSIKVSTGFVFRNPVN
jgi:opacity protein-like surface antigen